MDQSEGPHRWKNYPIHALNSAWEINRGFLHFLFVVSESHHERRKPEISQFLCILSVDLSCFPLSTIQPSTTNPRLFQPTIALGFILLNFHCGVAVAQFLLL